LRLHFGSGFVGLRIEPMHLLSDKLFERCPKCGALPMVALDVEMTRSSGTVVFRCGRCREG
jgi:transcription elongation factor Elf1